MGLYDVHYLWIGMGKYMLKMRAVSAGVLHTDKPVSNYFLLLARPICLLITRRIPWQFHSSLE